MGDAGISSARFDNRGMVVIVSLLPLNLARELPGAALTFASVRRFELLEAKRAS
jgi:hypothetical protein